MKERLTGAIILVALIVLLVPELLTGPIAKKSARTTVITYSLPAAHPEPPIRTYTLTLGKLQPTPGSDAPSAAQAPAPGAKSAQESSLITSEHTPASPRTATSHQDAPSVTEQSPGPGSAGLQAANSPAHKAMQEPRSSGSSGGWAVQLGSFASHQNADRLARSLRGKGFRMSVSPGRAGSRVLWRVRAGPTRDRAGALHLAARLKALGHRGELIPLK